MPTYRDFVAPAAQALGDDRIGTRPVDNDQRRNRRRPPRLLVDVTHAAQIAFTLFADVADEQQRRSVHQLHRLQGSGNRQQSNNSGRVVGDARAVELVIVAPHRNRRVRGEDSIDVSAQGDEGRAWVSARTDPEDIPQLVAMNVSEREFRKALSQP